jgi:hypothetical protein
MMGLMKVYDAIFFQKKYPVGTAKLSVAPLGFAVWVENDFHDPALIMHLADV